MIYTNPAEDTDWHNQPQSNAMTSAAFLFIAGGMEMALGLGWNINTYILTTEHFQFSWFIGVIAGAIIAAPLISYIQKRIFFLVSSILMLASGIIFVSVPFEYDAIIAARYVSGVAIGLTTVAFIVHGSEVSAPSYRGAVLSLEQYALTFGLAIQVIYASQWTSNMKFAANRVHGIFIIAFALIALISVLFVIESPIFHIRKGNDREAIECLRLLKRPQMPSNIINIRKLKKAKLEHLKTYVVEEQNQSFSINFQKSLLPFIKVLLFRAVVAFTFSIPLNSALELTSYISLGSAYSWPPTVFVALRTAGTFLAMWLLDRSFFGRKLSSLISLLCIAGLSIGIGVQFSNDINLYNNHQTYIIVILLLILQIFAGIFTPSSSAYLGEAFPLVSKPYLIALCVCVQQVIHIITIITYVFSTYNAYTYFIIIGCIMFGLFIYFALTIPETRNTTLREAHYRFQKLLYLKFS